MTRAEYQKYRESQGHSDVGEDNRAYRREIKEALQCNKPVPPKVLAEYKQLKGSD